MKDDMPEDVRTAIWNCHLDGWRMSEIVEESWHFFFAAGMEGRQCSASDIRKILSTTPPERVQSDPRYVHGVRAFWISASGQVRDEDISVNGMIVAFQPPRLTAKIFQKAVRAICRDFRSLSPTGYVAPHVMEGIEMEPALRMLHAGKTIGWVIAEDGLIARYSGEFGISAEVTPGDQLGTPNP